MPGWGQGPWGGQPWGNPPSGFFQNLGFEAPGNGPGQAAAWTISASDPGGSYADFGPNTPRDAVEGFELWVTYRAANDNSNTVAAFFVATRDGASPHTITVPQESFETGWPGTDTFGLTPANGTDAQFGLHHDLFDGFENSWYMVGGRDIGYIPQLTNFDTTGAPGDDFETGWLAPAFFPTLGGPGSPSLTAATFGEAGVRQAAESFEAVFPALQGTANPVDSTIFVAHYPYPDNLLVRLVLPAGQMPGGLVAGQSYYVLKVDANRFQLSLTPSGAAITITSVGTAPFTVQPDAANYWYDLLAFT